MFKKVSWKIACGFRVTLCYNYMLSNLTANWTSCFCKNLKKTFLFILKKSKNEHDFSSILLFPYFYPYFRPNDKMLSNEGLLGLFIGGLGFQQRLSLGQLTKNVLNKYLSIVLYIYIYQKLHVKLVFSASIRQLSGTNDFIGTRCGFLRISYISTWNSLSSWDCTFLSFLLVLWLKVRNKCVC